MFHVLEDHDERVSLHTNTIELDNVLVLEIGQQLSLTVEVLACIVAGVLQRLNSRGREERKQTVVKLRSSEGRLL
jgi:hypothetical protein